MSDAKSLTLITQNQKMREIIALFVEDTINVDDLPTEISLSNPIENLIKA